MFRKILLFFFAIQFGVSALLAQNKTIDSLRVLLKNDGSDTNKAIHLSRLSWELANTGDYAGAFQYGNAAMQLASQLNFKKGIAAAYNNIGGIYYDQADYAKALQNHLASLKIGEEIGDKKGVANSYNNIGLIYDSQGDYDKALENHFTSLKIMEEIDDKKGIANSYSNIGLIYYNQANYDKALENHFASLKLLKEINDKKGIATSYNNIGLIYYDQNNYEKALENYFASLRLDEEIGDKKGIASSYNNIGLIYYKKGNINKALENYLASLKINEKIGAKQDVGGSYINVGDVYRSKGNTDEALKNYMTALKIFEGSGDKQGVAASSISIANIYLDKSNYSTAKTWLQSGLLLAKEIGLKQLMLSAYKGLSDMNQKMNDYRNAFRYNQLYSQLKDSIFNEAGIKKTIQLQMTYEFEKKEAAIKAEQDRKNTEALLASKRKNLMLYLLSGLSLILCLVSLVTVLLYRQNKLKTIQKTLQMEQKLLRLQMNPHFIFNSLTAVQGFINTDNKIAAGTYLSKVSRLIRSILENSREDYILFEKELQFLQNYLSINQLLMDNQFEFKVEVDESIDREQTFVPPMLAQPFIENALKHGIQNKKEKGLICVRFKKNIDTIIFEVEDNGKGLAKTEAGEKDKHKSLAKVITQERLANLMKISIEEVKIDIREIEDAAGAVSGTKTTFEIPVRFSQ